MTLQEFLDSLSISPETIQFQNTISVVEENYDFIPTEFQNGEILNEAGQNNGSCKIFSFAQIHELDVKSTLACFGDFYRKDVIDNPKGDDHQNIRNFMNLGWEGISFKGTALIKKT